MNIKKVISYVSILLVGITLSVGGSMYFRSQMVDVQTFSQYNNNDFHKAQITEIISEADNVDPFSMTTKEVRFKATISSGPYQHREIVINQGFNDQLLVAMYPLSAGDNIMLYRHVVDDIVNYELVSFQRSNQIWLLVGLFVLLIIAFGKMKGINALISLGFTIYAVFYILVPAILAQSNLHVLTLLVAFFITALSFALIGGLSKKTVSATLGCVGGMLIATIIAVLFMVMMRMSGVVSEEFSYLILIQDEVPINLQGVLFMGIIIGSLGAVMDVAMSISSSLEEIIQNAPSIKPGALIKSGLNIGKDIMGTMANTLILAYMGGSLSTVLLLIVYGRPMNLLIHSEYIASEVLQALAGSLGILFTIPVTAIVSALLMDKKTTSTNQLSAT